MSNSKNTLRIFCTLLVMQFLALPLFSQKSVHYVYDYTGKRTHKYTKTSETIYFNQFYSVRYDKNGSLAGGQIIKHIYLGNDRIVTKVVSKKNPSYSEEAHRIYYFHTDHLGSAQLITDFEGREYQRIEYTPYGETWVERTSNTGREYLPYKFTGKEQDEETGLYYFGARYLDPTYSRWLSTDPALNDYLPKPGVNKPSLLGMGGIFNTVNMNMYHYGANNPVRYIDPNGQFDFSHEFLRNYANENMTRGDYDNYVRNGLESDFAKGMQSVQSGISKIEADAAKGIVGGMRFMSEHGSEISLICYATGNVQLGAIIDGVSFVCDITLACAEAKETGNYNKLYKTAAKDLVSMGVSRGVSSKILNAYFKNSGLTNSAMRKTVTSFSELVGGYTGNVAGEITNKTSDVIINKMKQSQGD